MNTRPHPSHVVPGCDPARPVGRKGSPAAALALALPAALLLPAAALLADALQPSFNQVLLGSVAPSTQAWGIGVADFDRDGFPDIVSGNRYGDVHLYLGDGSGGFTHSGTEPKIYQLWTDAYVLAAGEFNGDDNPDFVLARTTAANEGQLHLYLGNGDGSFQVTGTGPDGEQFGVQIGIAGLDPLSLAAGDVDNDGDLDLISGERVDTAVTGDTADIILWRNQQAQGSPLVFTPEILIQGVNRGYSPLPEEPPYFPPRIANWGYGLALGDLTGDGLPDLAVSDPRHYLYIYENTGNGAFSPLRYNNISTGTRPFAYNQLEVVENECMPLALADVNDDGRLDLLTGNAGTGDGSVTLWVHEGYNSEGWPLFTKAGVIGSAGTDARGLAAGQLNPLADDVPDVVFGNQEGDFHGLFPELGDRDGDAIIDMIDNAPDHPNAPRLDMNVDGGINHLDQLDNDNDGVGDPADTDDDDDGVPDLADNAPFAANAAQTDSDGDGIGDVADPLHNIDGDGDGVTNGPFEAALRAKAMAAKARWSRDDTHFIIRVDALGRQFQNEFTQTFVDAAILDPTAWEAHKLENYNGIGDYPATTGYQVPADLPGGANCPVTVAVIPRQLWNAFGDPDPIQWINNRIGNPNLELAHHGTYHANNTPLGDWKDMTDRNMYSSETAGLTLEENYQLLRIGRRTMLGQYADDQWIQQSGAVPGTSAAINWSLAANPLVSYVPPYDTGDTTSRDATARLGYRAYSASIAEESGFLAPFFSPEGSHMEQIDQFGMFHASADLQVNPEVPSGHPNYVDYLQSITQSPGLNTWLIEEVEWSTRYCNDLPRLVPCPNPDGSVNRENNMVDPERWTMWLELLSYAKGAGEVMTMGDYALAMQFDNAPTVPNPDQADSDHDGIGDVVDDASLTAAEVALASPASGAQATLTATLLNAAAAGIPGQTVTFLIDTDGDGIEEAHTATTGADGVATVVVTVSGGAGTVFAYRAAWDGGVLAAEDLEIVRVGGLLPLRIAAVTYAPGTSVQLTVEGLDPRATYRLVRSPDLAGFPDVVVSGLAPAKSTGTLTDPDPLPIRAFYRVEQE